MFKFTKGTKKKNQKTEEPANAGDYLESDTNSDNSNVEEIETTLSIPNDWNIADESRYVYAFYNSQMPKLKKNQISIYGIELSKIKNNLEVTSLIRSTVKKNIQFGKTKIVLLDADNRTIARKEFDLSMLGTLPANSARPWTFVFKSDEIKMQVDESLDDWSLAFELKERHQLDLEESWEKSIASETKDTLKKLVSKAPTLESGEVNFMGVQAKRDKEDNLVVTILIRNGTNKDMTLEHIPLGVKDASNGEIVRGGFQMDNFMVKANTSKPWSFVFPKASIQKDEIDLSKWQAYPIQ